MIIIEVQLFCWHKVIKIQMRRFCGLEMCEKFEENKQKLSLLSTCDDDWRISSLCEIGGSSRNFSHNKVRLAITRTWCITQRRVTESDTDWPSLVFSSALLRPPHRQLSRLELPRRRDGDTRQPPHSRPQRPPTVPPPTGELQDSKRSPRVWLRQRRRRQYDLRHRHQHDGLKQEHHVSYQRYATT